jgi:para-aminobenzoate synthetase/4-amino-4-deoxychorismate lyase
MIVDLVRNDLGRVARFGSVAVPSLFDIERYPTLLQMTSTVTAELRDDVALDDLFAATFPCGSITGAPKFTALRAIAQLEDAPRGLYCGAIGVLRPDRSATFNVAIRTIVIDSATATASYGVGGGITWDSDAHAEYDETLAKSALLHDHTPSFRLLETLRLEHGSCLRLERHLRRLAESAEYWNFCRTVVPRARAALEREAARAPGGAWRIRLLASADGTVEVQRTPLEPQDVRRVYDVALARTAVSAHEPLLHHKTTARATYDARRADHPDLDDVLLYNEEGLITEFCNGNAVVELDGALLTPPRSCGLLAGTFRAELLERATIREHPITLLDVRRAARIWLINSVREWVPCRLL